MPPMRVTVRLLLLAFAIVFAVGVHAQTPVWLGAWGVAGTGAGQFSGPRDLAVAPNGAVYVVDNGNRRIQIFDATGLFLGQWGSQGTGPGQFSSPYGIAIDPSGNVYVSDVGAHRIQKFDPSGAYLA